VIVKLLEKVIDFVQFDTQSPSRTNDITDTPVATKLALKQNTFSSYPGQSRELRKHFESSDRALADIASPDSFFSIEDEMSDEFRGVADDERRAYLQRRVMEEEAHLKSVQEAKDELERLEDEYVHANDPAEKKRLKALKWKADRRLDECNRRLERFQSSVQFGELTLKISNVEDDVTLVKDRQTTLEGRQKTLEKFVEEEAKTRTTQIKNIEDQVAQLAANQAILYQEQGAIRKTVDQIDNRVRLQSLVFHGIDTSSPYEALAKFLPIESIARRH
jgi:hypothetical protein